MHTDRWLDVLFGMGDDDFPFWLMSVRANILLCLLCWGVALLWHLRRGRAGCRDIAVPLVLTVLAGLLRFVVAGANLLDFGGIPYSRMLLGYRGHFATAQFYSLFYELTARDIEHAIFFNRIAGTLTIPLVYALCRLLEPRRTRFPAIAALLCAVSPLHILFSASDSLAVFSLFLTATSYAMIAAAERAAAYPAVRAIHYLGGFAGLVLSTQVRYENVLFLVPPAVYLLVRRRHVRWRVLIPAGAVAAAWLAFDAYQAAAAGLSFQNPVRLVSAVDMVVEHLLVNPFPGVALLAIGTCGLPVTRAFALSLSAALTWVAALSLPLFAESGHGAARVFTSWLILVLPLSAYGLTRMMAAPRRLVRGVAAATLFCLAVQPLLFAQSLASVYLEMREHEFFKRAVHSLPGDVDALVVPDDELLRRETNSTVELQNKYSMTLAGMAGAAERVRLVRLTDYLERPEQTPCRPGSCAFLFGLPCVPQQVYPFTENQCRSMVQTHRLESLLEQRLDSAPFLSCGIYVGRMREQRCRPTIMPRTFALYRIAASQSGIDGTARDRSGAARGE